MNNPDREKSVEIEEVILATNQQMIAVDMFTKLAGKYLRENVKNFSAQEARFLVDAYYRVQSDRIRSMNQLRYMEGNGIKSNLLLSFLAQRHAEVEAMCKKALHFYAANHPIGEWLMEVHGIGPVIAAGLLAHIDINKAPTVGHIWAFAGLDPTTVWTKGEKRPFNADLKKICWHAGQSFVKFHNSPKCVYGHLYAERKKYEVERNERGGNAERAAKDLLKYNRSTDAYKHCAAGKLPPAQLQARAERWAVKIFLSHLHEVWYKFETGKEPPAPFAIAILGHAHKIEPSHAVKGLKIPNQSE